MNRMKNILIGLSCIFFFTASGQNSQDNFDGKKWVAPYDLDVPMGWDVERF
jgi:hypothetical protein